MENSREEELIPYKAFSNDFEAEVAKSKLEAEGVECFLSGDIMNQLSPRSFFDATFGGVKLWIKKSDEALARELLDNDA